MIDVPYRKRPEANISLRKDGTAEVKCGDFKEVLPGPTLPDIVKQFRAWLPDKLAARRREKGGPPIPQDLSLPMPGFP
jgi:hypothetical protein